jgi:histidinol-phosphate aminotransferase
MDYERPTSFPAALRLHLNENTAGCSPKVIEAIRAIDATRMAVYPDYEEATRECAEWLGVDPSWVVLTNGLDEGIWAAAGACIRAAGPDREAVIPVPAFDMYAACVQAAGGRAVFVPPGPELAFPLDAVLAAIRPATRIVYLCSPNNPSGLAIRDEDIGTIARSLPEGALLFLDEAYVDFAEGSFLPLVGDHPNVLLGRTFAKAYGLAALRIGCLVARPQAISIVQRVIPPYSLNVCAVEGMRAALKDQAYRQWYAEQVEQSRQLVYEACRRRGVGFWASQANFVLVRVGDRCRQVVEALASRGILVRDRSAEPGCAGCIRITAGVVKHTQQCLAALEEVL